MAPEIACCPETLHACDQGKQAVTEFERRYPSRLRRSLSQPESAQGSGHQGSTSKDEESGSDQVGFTVCSDLHIKTDSVSTLP